MEIKTIGDWWKAVDDNWDDLLEIIFHTMIYDHPAYDPPGDAKGKPTGRDISRELEHLRKQRDMYRLARYFNAAWGLSSEAYAWSTRGWGVLCDLCSEEGSVLEEELFEEEQ